MKNKIFLYEQNEEINAIINEIIKIKNLQEKNIQLINEKNEGNIKFINKIKKEEENNKVIDEMLGNNYILNKEEENKNIWLQKENNLDIRKELIIIDEPKEKKKIINYKKENNKIIDDKIKLIVEKK